MDGQSTPQHPPATPQPSRLAEELKSRVPSLEHLDLENSPETDRQAAEAVAILVGLARRIEHTIVSQLEVLGKNHAPINHMLETLENQDLLRVDQAMQESFRDPGGPLTPLRHYTDLLVRWWSAVLAGVQSTVLEIPHELSTALNPDNWELQRKRWTSEESAYWKHYRHIIKSDTPLKVGDKMKTVQAEKTLEAYAILGGQVPPSEQDQTR